MPRLSTIGRILLCIGGAILASCCADQSAMPYTKEIKTAQEIRTVAGRAASSVLPDEAAETIPVPKRLDGKSFIQILYYRQVGSPGERKSQPPDHCMLIDPESGKVVRFWRCTPSEIGLDKAPPTIAGAGIQSGMTTEEYVANEERLLAISQPVWKAFFRGSVPDASDTRALVQEYRQLFQQTATAEEAAFTRAAAVEFFQWLDTVAK